MQAAKFICHPQVCDFFEQEVMGLPSTQMYFGLMVELKDLKYNI